MKKIITLLTILALHGCTIMPYEPIKAEIGQKKQSFVTWEIIENPAQFCKDKYNLTSNNTGVLACTAWKGDKCTIYTDQSPSYELLGHELRHCFDFDWHK